ncbi:MAG: DUF6279 family lipoprotein [Gammaproteobacteria bacterium]
MKTVSLILLIAIVTVTGISACSFKTLYNKLDYLIPEYVAGMVTLDDVLEDKVERRSLALINWHRNTQLKVYADWLQTVQQQVGSNLTGQQVKHHIDDINRFYRAFIIQLNQEMSEILPLLNELQQNEMFSHIAQKNEKYREQYVELEDEERIEAYNDGLLESYESWLGALSAEQETAITLAAQKMQSTAELRLWRRLEWQKGIQKILSSQDSRAIKTQSLKKFMSGFENIDTPSTREKSEANRQIIASLTVHIAHSLTQAQKAHFMSETNDYIRMFIELAENR